MPSAHCRDWTLCLQHYTAARHLLLARKAVRGLHRQWRLRLRAQTACSLSKHRHRVREQEGISTRRCVVDNSAEALRLSQAAVQPKLASPERVRTQISSCTIMQALAAGEGLSSDQPSSSLQDTPAVTRSGRPALESRTVSVPAAESSPPPHVRAITRAVDVATAAPQESCGGLHGICGIKPSCASLASSRDANPAADNAAGLAVGRGAYTGISHSENYGGPHEQYLVRGPFDTASRT